MATIAVIEDEAQILSTLEELLTLAGHRVLTASDGQSGLRLIQAQLPDLVLCDLMLPRLDGYSVLTALRQ
ncbi:MAG TPA: response regulator, partial [Trichocoleus sp.]